LIGRSAAIRAIENEIDCAARSDAKVLITGETGVGKEVVSRLIHRHSARSSAPLVTLNCAGLPDSLLESELFGHVRGSFTGAYRDKPGLLEMAPSGTVFLDEVGEMTPRMQVVLLRFLETGEIQKVGAERMARATNVRIMAATNRDLRDLIVHGQFREDLYYRINVIHLMVPPLRERREDIPLLIDHFMRRFTQPADGVVSGNGDGSTAGNGHSGSSTSSRHYSPVRSISAEAMEALCDYAWPGNVRQVENVVERMVVTGSREVIQVSDLPPDLRAPGQNGHGVGRERRRTVADDLFRKLVEERQSFWQAVYPLYMNREITRSNVRELVHKGLEEARGNYKIVLKLFNMESSDYKRFLNFLRKHDCQLPFKQYR